MTIAEFLDSLAAKTPTPGGGSASALCGSIGVSLGVMVARYSDSPTEGSLLEAKTRLYPIIEEDAAAYDQVKKALKMPKGEERTARLQETLVGASKVPFRGMEIAASALTALRSLSDNFNQNLVTDLLAACDLVMTAINGFSYNVLINVKGIKDQAFCKKMTDSVENLIVKTGADAQFIKEKLKGFLQKSQ